MLAVLGMLSVFFGDEGLALAVGALAAVHLLHVVNFQIISISNILACRHVWLV